jgi:ketosteroid isomerase-like protein
MSTENVEIVRELMALWERARENGEPPPHTNLLAPDFEIDMSRRVFNPAVYRGIDGLARLNEEIRDVWEEFRNVSEQFIDAGDRVVVIVTSHARGRGSGVELETRTYATICTLRDGQVTRVEVGVDPNEALKAVGLEK